MFGNLRGILDLLRRLSDLGIDLSKLPEIIKMFIDAAAVDDLKGRVIAILNALKEVAKLTTGTELDDNIVATIDRLLVNSGLLDLITNLMAESLVSTESMKLAAGPEYATVCESKIAVAATREGDAFSAAGFDIATIVQIVQMIMAIINQFRKK